ncbi:MAG: polysaccharide deacetylase family protein [Oleiphilaceae bacterium]|nr:polysaccharide deacetylase family protein [Oleiphilaceae bacterium]
MYHRVLDNEDVFSLSVQNFRQQMAYLSKNYQVIPIKELLRLMNEGGLRSRHVALTFDDGHLDFYENTWPILKEFSLPASLYVTTEFVNARIWLWPDLLKFVLNNTSIESINFPGLGEVRIFNERNAAWKKMANHLLKYNSLERLAHIKSMASALDVELPKSPVEPFKPLNWKQLKEMEADGLDIGSHTLSHPILSLETKRHIFKELFESRNIIAEQIGYVPEGICYPNGMLDDVSADVIAEAERHYRYGLMACRDVPIASKYMIGRIAAPQDIEEFKLRLVKG